jgi:hypothetical protein
MSGNNFSINPVRQSVNNFFESITNSSNPTYIQPISQQSYQQPRTDYVRQNYHQTTFSVQQSIYKLPTTMYTPDILRSHFEALSGYESQFYGNK